MAGSVNKVILIGRLGRDPETRTLQNGNKTTAFSMATSESWKDKDSGERKEKTQWHRIVIFNERVGEIADRYLKKGSCVYVEGQLEQRKYIDKDGADREIIEIIIGRFKGELTLMDSRSDSQEHEPGSNSAPRTSTTGGPPKRPSERSASPSWDKPTSNNRDLDDDIPF